MENQHIHHPPSTTQTTSGGTSQRGSGAASEYFNSTGLLWIIACTILAVAAGYWIPRAEGLLQTSSFAQQNVALPQTAMPALESPLSGLGDEASEVMVSTQAYQGAH